MLCTCNCTTMYYVIHIHCTVYLYNGGKEVVVTRFEILRWPCWSWGEHDKNLYLNFFYTIFENPNMITIRKLRKAKLVNVECGNVLMNYYTSYSCVGSIFGLVCALLHYLLILVMTNRRFLIIFICIMRPHVPY